MTLIYAYQNRGLTREFAILDTNGDTITPGVNDEIRAIIQREGETAVLTVASDAPTANGSTFTKGAANVLRLDDADLGFDPGVYSLIIDYFDNADAGEFKNVDRQSFHLEAT